MELKTQTPLTPTTNHGSIDSLSHCSSPRMMEALSDQDQCSQRSDPDLIRVKFMCSYGGRILPRPHDSQLRYVGGETRLLNVSRHITFADLMAKLTAMSGKNILLKFQLPNEELDSLVSVHCDEDLENMMEEYDRIESRDGSPKLRLFLFPAKSQSASMVDFHDYDFRNVEQRFVDAVNGLTRRQNSMPVVTSSQGLPDFLFGLDVLDHKQDRNLAAAQKKPTLQALISSTRSSHEAGDLNLENESPSLLHPPGVDFDQPSLLLDPSTSACYPPTKVSVANHSLHDLEMIKQLASLISATPDHQEPTTPEKKLTVDSTIHQNFVKNPEAYRLPTSEYPHGPGLSAAMEEKQHQRNDDAFSVSTIRTEVKMSPVELPIPAEEAEIQRQGEQDQSTRKPSDGASATAVQQPQLPRAAASAFPQQITPDTASSQFPAAITSILGAGSGPHVPQRAFVDPQRTGATLRQVSITQPHELATNLYRQLASAATVCPEQQQQQQQPLPLPRINLAQPVDQTPPPRAPRVQSPSRFCDMPLSTPFQVQWMNNPEERMILRPQQQRANAGAGTVTIQSIQQYDPYVDANGHVFYDPQLSHSAGLVNTPELAHAQMLSSFQDAELSQLRSDQTLDSSAYPGAAGGAQLAGLPQVRSAEGQKPARLQQARSPEDPKLVGSPQITPSPEGQRNVVGSPESHRHVNIHQVLRT